MRASLFAALANGVTCKNHEGGEFLRLPRDRTATRLNDLSEMAFWPNSRWALPAAPVASETAFSFERPDYLDVDARGIGYFSFYAPPKKLGAAIFYLGTFKDVNGDFLRGEEATSSTCRPTCLRSSSGP